MSPFLHWARILSFWCPAVLDSHPTENRMFLCQLSKETCTVKVSKTSISSLAFLQTPQIRSPMSSHQDATIASQLSPLKAKSRTSWARAESLTWTNRTLRWSHAPASVVRWSQAVPSAWTRSVSSTTKLNSKRAKHCKIHCSYNHFLVNTKLAATCWTRQVVWFEGTWRCGLYGVRSASTGDTHNTYSSGSWRTTRLSARSVTANVCA